MPRLYLMGNVGSLKEFEEKKRRCGAMVKKCALAEIRVERNKRGKCELYIVAIC